MQDVHLRRLFLTFLIPMCSIATKAPVESPSTPQPAMVDYSPQIEKWRMTYYIHDFDQTYKNALASFIAYLLDDKPSSETFNRQFNALHEAFPNPMRDFHLATVKLFENAILEAYKAGSCNDGSWNCMLNQCYDCVYGMLESENATYCYGNKSGKGLPQPKNKNK